ncbi:hypothetical protein ACFRAQ_19275 [Nocardia sp. NPDC056611]|uniref:hypothetical protein n=1 Tax=Nocardia sp. NPDC056611 TaxID=3345877 RepID=UPI00366C966B
MSADLGDDFRQPTEEQRRQRDAEANEWWARNYGRRVELGGFGEALSALLATELTDWSWAEIDEVYTKLAWESTRDDAAGLVFAAVDGAELVAVETRRVATAPGFGYGEFTQLVLSYPCGSAVVDHVFTTALADCVGVLGEPDLVGGPGAQAMWWRGGEIVTLGRSIRPIEVSLRIEPRGPRETEREFDWEYHEDHWPGECWLAWPDESRAWDIGALGDKEPDAATLEELEDHIDRLFLSLTVDLPVLHPLVPHVIWVITLADRPHWIAQGFFAANAQSRLEVREDDHARGQMYNHGVGAARQMAAETKAAIRRSGVKYPSDLRFQAWVSPAKPALQAFRLGLRWDEHRRDDD